MAGFSEDFKRKIQSESLPVSRDLWSKLDGTLTASDKKKKSVVYYFIAIAAGLALLLVSVFGVKNYLNDGSASPSIYATASDKNPSTVVTPGSTEHNTPIVNEQGIIPETTKEGSIPEKEDLLPEAVVSVNKTPVIRPDVLKKGGEPGAVNDKKNRDIRTVNNQAVAISTPVQMAMEKLNPVMESRLQSDVVQVINTPGLKNLTIQKTQGPELKRIPALPGTGNPANVVVIVEKEDLSDKIYSFISNKAEKVVSKIERKKSGLLPDEINIIY